MCIYTSNRGQGRQSRRLPPFYRRALTNSTRIQQLLRKKPQARAHLEHTRPVNTNPDTKCMRGRIFEPPSAPRHAAPRPTQPPAAPADTTSPTGADEVSDIVPTYSRAGPPRRRLRSNGPAPTAPGRLRSGAPRADPAISKPTGTT